MHFCFHFFLSVFPDPTCFNPYNKLSIDTRIQILYFWDSSARIKIAKKIKKNMNLKMIHYYLPLISNTPKSMHIQKYKDTICIIDNVWIVTQKFRIPLTKYQ